MAESRRAILLPLRLETLFDQPAGDAPWRLRVLIVPDEPSVDRHDDRAHATELAALDTAWRSHGEAALDEEKLGDVLARVAETAGAPRAAWLLRRYLSAPPGPFALDLPRLAADRAAAPDRDEPRGSRLAGLPRRVDFFALWDGEPDPVRIGTTELDKEALERDSLAAHEDGWWTSPERARETGLAAAFDLDRHPEQLVALVAVGLGDDDPAELFMRHRDAGLLAVLEPGTPTNTVHGAPAAPLGRGAPEWLETLTRGFGAVDQSVSFVLCGHLDLAPLPGGNYELGPLGTLLVQSLWPALWGHALKDVWGLSQERLEVIAEWSRNVAPEGALPPIRIGSQPYGLLPASALGRWRPAPGDDAIEEVMRPWLLRIRDVLAGAARTRSGTVDGAPTEQLLEVLGRAPASEAYSWRRFGPLELLELLLALAGRPTDGLEERWEETARAALDLRGDLPARRYVATGWPHPLRMRLVEATEGELREAIERIPTNGEARGPRGDTLLVRLLTLSRTLAYAEAHRGAQAPPVTGPMLDDVAPFDDSVPELYRWASHWSQGNPVASASRLDQVVDEAIQNLAELLRPGSDAPTDRIARGFRATLDCASHRVDPWLVAIAGRRFGRLHGEERPVLGLYGWVDRPYDGPRDTRIRGIVHAPSDAQARTAVVLRDKALFDPEAARWKLNLDSWTVRTAGRIAAGVRGGAHLAEAVGREVERIVAADDAVRELRRRFPLRTEHEGRRTCDGTRVLAATAAELAGVAISADARTRLDRLRSALDAYGDLLVADAVYDVVQGRPETAAATMDAAAGLALPPELDVVRTPRRGRTALTTVLLALRPAPVTGTAARRAEPAFAAFLREQTGEPGSAAWTWLVGNRRVSLADVDLEPVHALALTADDVQRLLRKATGRPAGSSREPAAGAQTLARARRIAASLACEPATAQTLDPSVGAVDDGATVADLRARLDGLLAAAKDLAARLPAGNAQTVRAAARWGIVPREEADKPGEEAAELLAERIARVEDAPAGTPLELARRLRELACPGAPLPILARLPAGSLAQQAGPLRVEPRSGAAAGRLDRDWLAVVAAVRPPLARLEAFQLETTTTGHPRLRAASNRLDDPWGTRLERDDEPDRLVIAYLGGDDAGAAAAVGVLDGFGETIPVAEHTTSGAFHFDAPGARAPQAILLAATPDVDRPLDEETLAAIVLETRELAHARMAVPADLAEYAALVPLTFFPVAEPTGVPLDRP